MHPLFRTAQTTRRYLYIVFFVFCSLVLVQIGEIGARIIIGSSWDTYSQRRSKANLEDVVGRFRSIQNAALGTGREIASTVRSSLSSSPPDTLALFPTISVLAQEEQVGVEVYGQTGSLLAWDGPSGPSHKREIVAALSGRSVSRVDRTSIYSQLVLFVPVRGDSSVLGAVVVRRVIDVDYPVDNKFVAGEDIADELTGALAVPVSFDFTPDAEPTRDGRVVSGVLYGVDSSVVGVVNVGVPLRSAYIESVSLLFDRITSVGLALLAALLAVGAIRRFGRIRSLLVRSLLVTSGLWLCRYVFLWAGFPSDVVPAGIFDPSYFASQFGGGIAKSIGELMVTAMTLVINAWVVVMYGVGAWKDGSLPWSPRSAVARIVLSMCAITLMWFLVRGYVAVIRSGVYDSTLKYLDPRVIVPSLELGLMVFNLFVIGVALIVVIAALLLFMYGMFSGHGQHPWVVASLWFLSGSVVFGLVHPSPLTTLSYRLFFAACTIGFTYYVYRSARTSAVLSLKNFLLMLGLSGAFLYPLLVEHIKDKDQDRIRVFADVVLRPSDSWLKYLVQESLKGFLDIQTEDILANGQREDIDQLAFSHWARSAVNREGYSSLFAVVDADGNPMSSFQIGGGELENVSGEYQWSNGDGEARVFETGPVGNPTKVYVGSVPIPEHSERPFAYAIVVIAAGKQELIRDENLPFLRSDQQERVQSFYRPIIVTEYQKGILAATRNNALSMKYRLPDTLRNALRAHPGHSIWVNENIDGKRYQSLYVQAADGDDRVIALTVGDIDLNSHLYNIVKVVVYYTLIAAAILVLLVIVGSVQGRVYRFSFRDKLLVAFVLTALIPLTVIGVYTRSAAQTRMLQAIANRLERETAAVESQLRTRVNVESPMDSTDGREPAEATRDVRLLPDYNFYIGTELKETTRPELFEAGLLDTRLSGTAYNAIVIEGKRFYVQTESIGRFRYIVGYRPLLNAQGGASGVVSVPTLYRQDQIETDVAQRNALLFGVLAFVCLVIGIVATAVANRLAGPIHRLTDATQRVSLGDLDVNLSADEQNGEVGELIRSFGKMTKDLKMNREHLVRYERELAWKEMAKQVAHEIKNPLTPMKLSLQHLQQLYHDGIDDFGNVLDDMSKTVIDQIDGLSRIASEFSHFARMPSRNPEHLDINAVLKEASGLFEGEQQVEFQYVLQEGLPPVLADRDELRRAFVNIIRNGIQAMNGRGLVNIETSVRDGHIDVRITDSGAGVPEEVRDKLFEPNFSTKTEGMGLGLAIVKNTIDDMGGTIDISSTTGTGATVTISLPGPQGLRDGVPK